MQVLIWMLVLNLNTYARLGTDANRNIDAKLDIGLNIDADLDIDIMILMPGLFVVIFELYIYTIV